MDPHHWYRRVLPVSALAVGLVAVLALVFPGVRDQVALSASHRPQEYVALSFARSDDGTVAICQRTGAELAVSFTVASGMREQRDLAYVVTAGHQRRTGTASVEPGTSVDVTQVLRRPARGFDLTVELPEAGRELVAHCRGAIR